MSESPAESQPATRGAAVALGALRRPEVLFAALQCSVAAAFVAQCFIEATEENLLASALVLTSSTLTLQYLRLSRSFAVLPLSSFAILGLCMTTQCGALIAQSCAWTSLTANLRVPLATFMHLAEFQCVAILAHWIYRLAQPLMATRSLAAQALARIGLFTLPRVESLWVMGGLGVIAQYLCGSDDDAIVGLGIVVRVAQGFTFLAWAPFLIPVFHARFGDAFCCARRQYLGLGAYALLAMLLGMGLNFRGVMFFGVVTALLLWILVTFADERPFRPRQLWVIAGATLIGATALAYAADLATAMAVARSQRGQVSPLDMVVETLDSLRDSYVIQRYRDAEQDATRNDIYDEYYIANSVVARLVETKFHDNMFFLAGDLQPAQAESVARQTTQRLWEILPRPLMLALNPEADIEKISETSSMGDFFVYLQYGNELGGFKTGSLFAHGLALFPVAFPLIYGMACLLMFLQWDALSRREKGGGVELSPLGMLLVLRIFMYGITTESISSSVAYCMRTYWQNIVIYLVVFHVVEAVVRGGVRPSGTVTLAADAGQPRER